MATKRKLNLDEDDDEEMQQFHISNKKHTLDSDEDDSDDYEKDNGSDIEGEEDGESNIRDEVKITPFNMREEMEEGHFDVDGTYHWNKDNDIKDNWLDNIDWVKIEKEKSELNVNAEDSNSADKPPESFNETHKYNELLEFMQAGETVQGTLQRLGKTKVKISSAERIRRKKLGIIDEVAETITKFTALVNELLTKTGNMDIYQETYEDIKQKQKNEASTSNQSAKPSADSFDMYAEDFSEKEQSRLETSSSTEKEKATENVRKELAWEFKWTQEDKAKINGPFTTKQMHKWSEEKYFKDGVYVRKVGEDTKFYTSNRIDFDLYL